MRMRTGAAVALGVSVMVLVSGCQPGYRGPTGLMLGNDDLVYGVVNVCHGQVAHFSLWDDSESASWQFDEPVSGMGTVPLETVATMSELVGTAAGGYFSAGTDGVAGVTTPLHVEDVDLKELTVGNVSYLAYVEASRTYEARIVDLETFAAKGCEGY